MPPTINFKSLINNAETRERAQKVLDHLNTTAYKDNPKENWTSITEEVKDAVKEEWRKYIKEKNRDMEYLFEQFFKDVSEEQKRQEKKNISTEYGIPEGDIVDDEDLYWRGGKHKRRTRRRKKRKRKRKRTKKKRRKRRRRRTRKRK